jgi:hypothetical protein
MGSLEGTFPKRGAPMGPYVRHAALRVISPAPAPIAGSAAVGLRAGVTDPLGARAVRCCHSSQAQAGCYPDLLPWAVPSHPVMPHGCAQVWQRGWCQPPARTPSTGRLAVLCSVVRAGVRWGFGLPVSAGVRPRWLALPVSLPCCLVTLNLPGGDSTCQGVSPASLPRRCPRGPPRPALARGAPWDHLRSYFAL